VYVQTEVSPENYSDVSTFQCARVTRGVIDYANDSINRGVLIQPAGDMRPTRIAQRCGHCDGSVVLQTHQEKQDGYCVVVATLKATATGPVARYDGGIDLNQ
jgi:hypothetical protein